MDQHISGFLRQFEQAGLYPDFYTITDGVNEPECVIGGKKYILFCANNYLGLTNHPEVKRAMKEAVDKYGAGPGGSRVISGNVDIIEKLERAIADWTGTEDCLTFPTGYMANVGVVRALMDPLFNGGPHASEDGVIFSDEFNHGSIVDGCRLSKAKKVIYRHDDLEDLEQKLKENDLPNKLIITESVFSLEGEILEIPKYIELAKKYGAKLMVDDAHGIGVIGERGGGIAEYYNCGKDIDVLMGCMDKAMGGTGGYLCGNRDMIKYLRIACRSSILSSAIPTSMAGAMLKSVEILKMMNDERRSLLSKANVLKTGLINNGFQILGKGNIPALALIIHDERKAIKMANFLFDQGIICPAIRWPAVPQNRARFRIIVTAGHTLEHCERLIQSCVETSNR